MKKLGVSLVAAFFVLAAAQQAMAAKAKKAKEDKPRGPAPVAKADAISEIRGDYKWGMTLQQVVDKISARRLTIDGDVYLETIRLINLR